MASTANKENVPSTPTQNSYEYSPGHPKHALKPISPNKTASSIGKLSFLQNDNIDAHFSQIHSVHEAILSRLFNLEVQTKQTGVDLDQLCDRLKNNNQHLNKLLQNISNYSEEVITEGNATKNDINNILSRLDGFDKKLSSGPSQDLLNAIKHDITKLLQINDQKPIPIDLDSIQALIASNNDTVETINGKLDATTSEITNLTNIHNSIIEQLQMKDKDLTTTINSQNEKLSKVLNDSTIVDTLNTLSKTQINEITAKITELQNKLPELDLAHKIIEPIVAELKSVSLDLLSIKLLEDILAAMEISESVSLNEKFRAHFNEKLDTATKTIVENKDAQTQNILDKVHQQEMLLRELTSRTKLSQTSQELESKIDTLQAKYDAMTQAYETRFLEFQQLQRDYRELSESTTKIVNNDKITKLNKVQQLHSTKMQNIMEGGDDKTPKRIVSSPIGIRNSREEAFDKFEPIYEHSDATNNSDVEEF